MSGLQIFGQAATRAMTVTQRIDEENEILFKPEDLDVDQWTAKPGDTIPLIFCGPDGGTGVWISPPLVRQGYQSAKEHIQSNFGYVISDGELGGISEAHIWHGSKRFVDFADRQYVQQFSTRPANYGTIIFSSSVGEEFNEFDLDTIYRVNAGSAIEIPSVYLNITRSRIQVSGASAITNDIKYTNGNQFSSSPGVTRSRLVLKREDGMVGMLGSYINLWLNGSRVETNILIPGDFGATVIYGPWRNNSGGGPMMWESNSGDANSDYPAYVEEETTVGGVTWRVTWGTNTQDVTVSSDSGWINGDGKHGMTWKMLSAAPVQQTITFTEHVKSSYGVGERPPADSAGDGGTFTGLTTLLMRVPHPVESDSWKRQAHFYVENGVRVTRLIGGALGSSSLFPDLIVYLMQRNGLVPTDLIDMDAMRAAAVFTSAQGMFYSGALASTQSLAEMMTRLAPFFLLIPTQLNGKYGFKPALPVNGTAIDKGSVTSVASFKPDNILAGSYSRDYTPLSQRKPFAALMVWRSQTPGKPGGKKVTEVRYSGTASNGPYEQFDLSDFCTTENHAIRAAKYLLARRKHVTHSIRFNTSLSASGVTPGDIIDVTISRKDSMGGAGAETYFYQVEQVSESQEGVVSIAATHFPTNASNQSLIALDLEDTVMTVG